MHCLFPNTSSLYFSEYASWTWCWTRSGRSRRWWPQRAACAAAYYGPETTPPPLSSPPSSSEWTPQSSWRELTNTATPISSKWVPELVVSLSFSLSFSLFHVSLLPRPLTQSVRALVFLEFSIVFMIFVLIISIDCRILLLFFAVKYYHRPANARLGAPHT